MDSHVEAQPLFAEPRRVVDRYAASDNEGAEEDAGKVRGLDIWPVLAPPCHKVPEPPCRQLAGAVALRQA